MLFDAEYIIHIDGASRGNPGHASYGFAILDPEGKVLHSGNGYIGITTNNVAEYTALLEALRFVLAQKIQSVEIRSDSELLVKQLNGEYKVKSEHLAALNGECRMLLRRLSWYEIKHVPRSQNKIADRLANEALDQQLKPRETEHG
ncbi:ribonuclease HI family protein [bacterium]|nr:ribonuclease HI family protein [bacterium]MCI0604209.1 ribonuclease HI family protein [bacterium]